MGEVGNTILTEFNLLATITIYITILTLIIYVLYI